MIRSSYVQGDRQQGSEGLMSASLIKLDHTIKKLHSWLEA